MILAYQPDAEFGIAENCHIVELANHSGDASCSIARARVAPGAVTELHALRDTVERYVILEGEGRVEIGGGPPAIVRPLDVAVVAAGVSQRITNTGSTDLVFLCVCTPRFEVANYVAIAAA
jgi:mannose-6-phosphate isomerase-like protein (cupin superfamily)